MDGKITLLDDNLQRIALDWQESEDYNEFINLETGERIHALSSKRGNVPFCAKKSEQRDALSKALEEGKFDWPVPGTRRDRMTRLLFVTLTYDHENNTRERSWASTRSTPIPGSDAKTGEINKFESNMSDIFGNLCKLVCKESTSDGWPAPHLIFLLETPIRIREYRGKDESTTWRIVDRRILRRIGKDPSMRSLSISNPREAISENPIWKNGFFDIQGIVKGTGHGRYKNEITYLFKYLTKCVSGETSNVINELDTINEAPEKVRTMLFTYLANKCFRTRDISFGKVFKERIGLVPAEKKKESTTVWKRIRTISGSEHRAIMENRQKKAIEKFRELFATEDCPT